MRPGTTLQVGEPVRIRRSGSLATIQQVEPTGGRVRVRIPVANSERWVPVQAIEVVRPEYLRRRGR